MMRGLLLARGHVRAARNRWVYDRSAFFSLSWASFVFSYCWLIKAIIESVLQQGMKPHIESL